MKLASAARCSIGLQQLVCKALTRLRSTAAGQKTGHNFTHVTEAACLPIALIALIPKTNYVAFCNRRISTLLLKALNRKVYSDSEVLVSSAAEVSKCLVDIFQSDVFGDEQIQVRIVPLHVTL